MLTISLIISAVMAVLPLADGHEYPSDIIGGHEGGEYACSEYSYEGYLYGDPVPFKNIPNSTPRSNNYNLHANVMASVDYRHWSVSEELGDCQCEQPCNSCGSDNAPDNASDNCHCLECNCPWVVHGTPGLIIPVGEKDGPCDCECDCGDECGGMSNPLPPGDEPPGSPSSGPSETCECENEYKWPTYAWASAWANVYFTQDTSPTQEFDDSILMEVFAKAWALDEVDKAEYADRRGSDDTNHPLYQEVPMKSKRIDVYDENGMLTTPRWVFSDTVHLSAGAYVIKDLVHTQSGCEPRLEEGQIPDTWKFHDQGGRARGAVGNIPNMFHSGPGGGMKYLEAESVGWTFGGRAP